MAYGSFPLSLLVVFLVFLGILAGLAIAVTKTVNPDGRVSRGFFGALGSSLAILFLCGLGLLGTALFGLALAVGTAIEKNPIESIEVYRDGVRHEIAGDDITHAFRSRYEPATYTSGDTAHVLFTVEGSAGRELLSFAQEVLGIDARDLERVLTVTEHRTASGRTVEVYEFVLPLAQDEIEELEEEIRRECDGLNVRLPDGIAIRFDGAERFAR